MLPFLLYSAGSYFGDVDLFNLSLTGTYRDSTAVSDTESKFFVLQRDSIVKMEMVFQSEFNEIKKLAV